jgi:Leucine-rich repeat (LRR) protein
LGNVEMAETYFILRLSALDARAIVPLLQNQHLQILNLSNNPIEMEGLIEIASNLARSPLRILDLSDCRITTSIDSEKTLHNRPPVIHRLKVLKLNGNDLMKRSATFWNYMITGVCMRSLHF